MDAPTPEDKVVAQVGRRERKSAETRERIFRAAIELFATRGLSNVTIEQITERADVGKGTFFNYFSNKEEVLQFFAASQVERLKEALATGEIHGEPRERVLQIVHVLSTHPSLTQDLARAHLMAYLHLGTEAESHCPTVWPVVAELADVIRTGQQSLTFAASLEPEPTAFWLLGQFYLAQLTWCTGYTSGPLPDVARRFVELALQAL
jgi:AcrR family transcriptional regulator